MDTVRSLLAAAPSGEARRDAEILLQHVLGQNRTWLITHDNDPLPEDQAQVFRSLWDRRQAGEPMAYLIGRRGFWTLDLAVSPAVLIPRPDTELLVETALTLVPTDATWDLADLGTGSGAIALAIASERPACRMLATDQAPEALDMARANAQAHGINNVQFLQGDWWAPLTGRRFHLVASNPPYVTVGDPHLTRGDLPFEPQDALVSGPDGLDDLRQIIACAPEHLHPGGHLLLEHGYDQGEAVRALLRAGGFGEVRTWRDLGGNERVSVGRVAQVANG
ncbi:MAG: peptide chain release factor N(5)-glutamine methyltransferase [Thioalkalivibrio sp.]